MSNILHWIKEHKESLESYLLGGGSITLGTLDLKNTLLEVAQIFQALAIIIGCVVVAIRLVHDSVALYRYITKGKE